jgi:hypothetical protein
VAGEVVFEVTLLQLFVSITILAGPTKIVAEPLLQWFVSIAILTSTPNSGRTFFVRSASLRMMQ